MAENVQFFSLIDWRYAISGSQSALVCQEMKLCAMQCYLRFTIILLASILNSIFSFALTLNLVKVLVILLYVFVIS